MKIKAHPAVKFKNVLYSCGPPSQATPAADPSYPTGTGLYAHHVNNMPKNSEYAQDAKICSRCKIMCKKYAQNMHKICRMCKKYAQNMQTYAQNMQKYAKICKKYAKNMQKICRKCKKYAKNMHNMQKMQKICKKYASGLTNMQQVQHTEYAKNMQNICKIYLNICRICKSCHANTQNMHRGLC